MNRPDRPRRPPLDRDEPVRDFTSFLGGSSGAGEPAPGTAEDDVARGVGVGYRLIEEYLRRGQQVAQAMWNPQGPLTPGAIPPFPGSDRLLEYSTQVVNLWFEMAKKAWPAAPTERTDPGGFDFVTPTAPVEEPPASGTPASPTGPAFVVALSVASPIPVEVTVDLRPDAQGKALVPHLLRTADGEAPPLRPELAWSDERRLRVTLRVPAGQVAGTYVGVVVDGASNLPLGTITAVVRAE